MKHKIAILYHCLFRLGDPPKMLPAAVPIIVEQMNALKSSGLLDAADDFLVGINDEPVQGGIYAEALLPANAKIKFHGLQCHNECRTIRMMEEWLPGHDDYYVLYFHTKGITHPIGEPIDTAWRKCMTKHCILNWRKCVEALDQGYDCAGVHFMEPPATPVGQRIFAGTFSWSKAKYLLTLPSIMERDRIKVSGIDSADSRFEAEVWIGNGPVAPLVKDFHPGWNPSKWQECKQ